MAWTGNKKTKMKDGSLVIHDPRPFFGMVEGFPDLVGWQSVVITQEMVGTTIARIIMPEVKTPTGKKGEAQERFQKKALKDGVKYGFVRSVEDFVKLVNC